MLDALKGFLAATAPRLLATGHVGAPAASLLLPAALIGGAAAVIGHVFSPWLRFRGGRGVATSLGMFLGIVPVPTLLAFLLWGVLLLVSRRVSVGSIGAAMAYPFLVFALTDGATRLPVTLVAAMVALLVIARHIPNIRRLLSGTEPPILGTPRRDEP